MSNSSSSSSQGTKGSRIRTIPTADAQPAEQPRDFVENVIARRRMNFFCVHKRELEDISQHNAESSTALALCTAFAGTAVGILSNFANTSVKDMSVFGDAFLFVGVPILLLLTLVYGLRSWSKYKKKNAIIKYIEDECK